MIIVFSGWREWTDLKFIKKVLDDWVRKPEIVTVTGVRVGDCDTGVDRMIQEELRLDNYSYTEYKADWKGLGKSAGPVRNNNMLIGTLNQYETADLLIALPRPFTGPYQGSGTWDCIGQAWSLGVEVFLPSYRRKRNRGNWH